MFEDFFFGVGVFMYGYVSNMFVLDGEYVYVFYGKLGVIVYDLDGNLLW